MTDSQSCASAIVTALVEVVEERERRLHKRARSTYIYHPANPRPEREDEKTCLGLGSALYKFSLSSRLGRRGVPTLWRDRSLQAGECH